MHVHVRYGLASNRSIVDADGEAAGDWGDGVGDQLLCHRHESHHVGDLDRPQVGHEDRMARRDDECVAGRDWVGIPEDNGMIVLEYDQPVFRFDIKAEHAGNRVSSVVDQFGRTPVAVKNSVFYHLIQLSVEV